MFVRNRANIIQKLTKADSRRYVSSKDNPADLISRSTETPLAIIRNKCWIPSVRNVMKEIIKNCITCRKDTIEKTGETFILGRYQRTLALDIEEERCSFPCKAARRRGPQVIAGKSPPIHQCRRNMQITKE
ncbi:hypothetical protein CEXT_50481 [Caerostris extrusa]|uniref:Integrase zinc-binding domain-containing protein n=1 Tax=Caerostris extrusa TaxID=172846 RepID=A0AAV4N5M7_CAEEX|nr:hypothetical protein CEXT_50481 [Caerostris extrusa]